MDKTAIKKYAVWARQDLINRVKQKSYQYGITENEAIDKDADNVNGKLLSATEKTQRKALLRKISQNGFDHVIEEVAYTWFNRFCALRFMEVNGYLPSHVRVFTDEHNKFKPQILSEAMSISLPGLNIDKVFELKEHNQIEELYKYLLIVQCNALSDILPGMFQKIEDHTELLFPDNLLREGSVIARLISDIPADNFDVRSDNGQIEIIGWLYQYYITEKHEEVVDPLHGRTVEKDDIPAATQLFTTDWVVRYIVDNSVGRYWLERNPDSSLKEYLQYFVLPKDRKIQYVEDRIEPQDVTVFDPCVGSGHFLLYAFDVLVKIYTERGYSARDAVNSIVVNNLFGLDIDERAAQLAYFSLMMKARQYDSRFLERRIQPNIFAIRESNYLSQDTFDYIVGNSAELRTDLQALVDTFYDAKEYGSLLQMPNVDFKGLFDRFDQIVDDIHFHKDEAIRSYLPVVQIAEILSRKYAAVVTNPPYLNKFDAKLKQFIVANYKNYGGDLFSAFIYRNLLLCKADGFAGYMTPNVWMFIKTYEKLRQYLLAEKTISSLIQMAKGAFFKEATVDICSFVLKNKKELVPGLYIRLEEFKGGMDVQRQKVLEAIANPNCGYFYEATASNFSKIPGMPIAYWVSEQFLKAFKAGTLLNNIGEIVTGISTGKNDLYLRTWSEVNLNSISIYASDIDAIDFNVKKWLPYNKGGEARKWYGNNDYVVKWSEAEHFHRSRPTFKHLYLKEGLTWSFVTSGMFSARYYPKGFLWDVAGSPCVIKNHDLLLYSLAFLSTKIANAILKIINPTINCQVDDIQRTPMIVDHDKMCIIYQIANDCVNISKSDWDSYETSWDFKKHPLI
mgnify:FL=1